jgi:2-pyrone-4,6-dicarboxylate lactonase
MDREYLPPLTAGRPPRIAMPAGACDAHLHIIGPRARFPFAEQRAFTPRDTPLEALLQLHDTLGITRAVIVQCNPHGTDNRALLDALQREPSRLRGVAIVEPDTSRYELRRMANAGVRALRFHHMPHNSGFSAQGMPAFASLAPVMAELGLHAQFMMDANELDKVMHYFKNWKLPVIIDHMGNVDATLGANQAGVQQMCRLLAEDRIWVKMSAAYRISAQYPDYPDARAIHAALVQANPQHVLWGSDWPHTRIDRDMPEDGHLLDLFNEWTPDAALRRLILVDNPARLYGFV